MTSPGKKFRDALAESLKQKKSLQVIGVADGTDALQAQKAGAKAIYISGSQMAASRGWADIGRLELKHVLSDVQRIMDSGIKLPVLVDIDTGFDDVTETIKKIEALGVAGVHIEDQEDLKVCGHLDGKHVVSKEAATARVKKAVEAKADKDFIIMARTDAFAVEGLEKTLERISSYVAVGADMIFAEAFKDLDSYELAKNAAGGKPVLGNMTEFGKVALKTPQELYVETKGAIDIVLNPLTIYRAQKKTGQDLYQQLVDEGTQRNFLDKLQTRPYFQDLIGYEDQKTARGAELGTQKKTEKSVHKP